MLKHLPAVIFFLCLTVIIINVSMFDRKDVYLVAVVVGSVAMAGQYLVERHQKKQAAPDQDEQLAFWQNQKTHVTTALADARRWGDDRVPFLEGQLAEAERQLRKLGNGKNKA